MSFSGVFSAQATYQSPEEECSIAILGNTYIVDLTGMQQINEDTGTARSVRRTTIEPPKHSGKGEGVAERDDERGVAIREDPVLGITYVQALFGVLYEVFNSMVREGRREMCMKYQIFYVCYRLGQQFVSSVSKLS